MLYGLGGIVFAALVGDARATAGRSRSCQGGGTLICAALLAIVATSRWPLATVALIVMGIGYYMLHNTLQTNATQMAPERRGTAVTQFAACFFSASPPASRWPA